MSDVTNPILLDATGQSIVGKLDDIKNAILSQVPAGDPVRITVVTPPTKTEYTIGDTVDLTGIEVCAIFSNNAVIDITEQCTFSPAEGEVAIGNTITASWTWQPTPQTFTATTPIEVSYVEWSTGTDAQVSAMIQAHYDGAIDLHDYWNVGDERTLTLSASEGDDTLNLNYGNSFDEQTITLVLLDECQHKDIVYEGAKRHGAFIVGLKKYMIVTGGNPQDGDIWDSEHDTNVGGWDACDRRKWCNSVFYNALPSALKGIFKLCCNITADGNTDTAIESQDYFAFPSAVEFINTVEKDGVGVIASATVESQNTQFEYYETSSNVSYAVGGAGSVWTRSPSNRNSTTTDFCYVNYNPLSSPSINLSRNNSLMPFGMVLFGAI